MCGLCGRFALVDFGLAQRLSESESAEHQSTNSEAMSQQNIQQSSARVTNIF